MAKGEQARSALDRAVLRTWHGWELALTVNWLLFWLSLSAWWQVGYFQVVVVIPEMYSVSLPPYYHRLMKAVNWISFAHVRPSSKSRASLVDTKRHFFCANLP